MLSLGLDPSLTGFGWCVHDPEARGKARVVDKGRFASPASDIFVQRYMGLRECVGDLLDDYPEVNVVGVESPPFGEQFSEGLYGLYLFVNEAVFTRRRDVVYFDPSTVKSLVKDDPSSRPGKMFKADMVVVAKAETGIAQWNNDEADAYHVARFAARFFQLLRGEIDPDVLTPAEQSSFLKQHTFIKGSKAGATVKSGAAFKEGARFFRFSQVE